MRNKKQLILSHVVDANIVNIDYQTRLHKITALGLTYVHGVVCIIEYLV